MIGTGRYEIRLRLGIQLQGDHAELYKSAHEQDVLRLRDVLDKDQARKQRHQRGSKKTAFRMKKGTEIAPLRHKYHMLYHSISKYYIFEDILYYNYIYIYNVFFCYT